jgi:hypothetical protein
MNRPVPTCEVQVGKVQAMKKILIILFVLFAGTKAIYADRRLPPRETDYFSENKISVAHVTPAKEKAKPVLEVFEIRDAQRLPRWRCELGNEVAPVEVYVSDDGEWVVTLDEWYKVGYGDHVLAFYSEKRQIKNYSLEQILDLPEPVTKSEIEQAIEQMQRLLKDIHNLDKEELLRVRQALNEKLSIYKLIPHFCSSRLWGLHSIKFFDTYAGELYFCIWLHILDRWMAWNPTNGEEVEVDEKMVESWSHRARLWALNQIERGTDYYYTPYEFLGKLKNPEDRPLIEQLLSDRDFGGYGRSSQTKVGQDGKRIDHLTRYGVSSAKRLLAEQILARWDGKSTARRGLAHPPLCYLGKVEGVVTLPKTDDPNKAMLWIYLVPATVPKDQWHREPPTQRLAVFFSDYSSRNYDLDHTRQFPFDITGVTPGEYWIKAVLDKTKPFSKPTDKFYVPEVGDYETIESPTVCVKAGETIENLSIDCTHKVADGND